MIKRVQHQQEKKKLAEELGMDAEDAVADYDESSDGSSSDDDSDSSSSEESSEAEEPANAKVSKKRKSQNGTEGKSGKKAKTESKGKDKTSSGDEEDSSDEDSDSDSDDDSDVDEDDSADGDASAETSALPPMSVSQAFTDPLYIKPGAPFYKEYQHRTCILCPNKLIKTEQIAKTHVASGSHQRALKRYITYAKREVPADKLDCHGEGMTDPRHLVAEMQARLLKQQAASRESALKGKNKSRIERREQVEKIKAIKKRVLKGEELTPEEKEGLTKRERRAVHKVQKKLVKKARAEAKAAIAEAKGVKVAPSKTKKRAKIKKAEEERKKASTGADGKVKKQGPRGFMKAKKLAARQAQSGANATPLGR